MEPNNGCRTAIETLKFLNVTLNLCIFFILLLIKVNIMVWNVEFINAVL